MKNLKIIIQTLIVILLLFFIQQYFLKNREEWIQLYRIQPGDITKLFFLSLISNLFFCAYFFQAFKHFAHHRMNFFIWFKIYVLSRCLNFYVIQGANIFRAVKLKKEFGFTYTRSIAMTTFLTWAQAWITFLVGSMALLLFSFGSRQESQKFSLILFVLTAATFCSPFLLRPFFTRLVSRWSRLKNITEKIIETVILFFDITRQPLLMFKLIGLFLIYFSLNVWMVAAGFKALDLTLSHGQIFLFTVTLLVSRSVNIVPGNLGISEWLCGYLSLAMGGELGRGIMISGILRLIDYLLINTLGIIFIKDLLIKLPDEERPG